MAAPWMAAPMATHRSGSTSPRGCAPNASTRRGRISGARVAPPTSRISSTCEECHDALLNPHDGDFAGAARETVDQDPLTLMLRRLVDQPPRGRFIDDACPFEPGDLAGLACSPSLRVREIRRHGDHPLADRP